MVPDLAVEVVSRDEHKRWDPGKAGRVFPDRNTHGVGRLPRARQVYVYTSLTEVRILPESAEIDGGEVVPGFRSALDPAIRGRTECW